MKGRSNLTALSIIRLLLGKLSISIRQPGVVFILPVRLAVVSQSECRPLAVS